MGKIFQILNGGVGWLWTAERLIGLAGLPDDTLKIVEILGMIPDWIGLPALTLFCVFTWQSEWRVRQWERVSTLPVLNIWRRRKNRQVVEDMTALLEMLNSQPAKLDGYSIWMSRIGIITAKYPRWFSDEMIEKHGLETLAKTMLSRVEHETGERTAALTKIMRGEDRD